MTPPRPRLRDRVGPERTAAILSGVVVAMGVFLVAVQPGPQPPTPTHSPAASQPVAATPSRSPIPTDTPIPASGSPVPSATSPATAGPSATPSSVPTASPGLTPPPAAGTVQNPGFEDGRVDPWQLTAVPGVSATIVLDAILPGGGSTSARIDIAGVTEARTGVSLRQTGLGVTTGTRYTVRLKLRAAALREVRIRVSGPDDASLATRLVVVGSAWSETTFEFTPLVTTTSAVLAIDLGRSDASTWIDDVSIIPTP